MDAALKTALTQPDINDVLISAVEHADTRMRRFYWRGIKPGSASSTAELIVSDKTAKDFVNEALKRLCSGKRAFDPQRSLLQNLNSITDSLIWTDKKSSDRTGLAELVQHPNDDGEWPDPLANHPGNDCSAAERIVQRERAEEQAKQFALVKTSFDGDELTQRYLDALSEGFYDIEEIATLTDISVPKIYEIRRKLKKHIPRVLGVTKYAELERKIEEPLQ